MTQLYPTTNFSSLDDELHALSITLNDQTSPNGSMISTPWRDRQRHEMAKFHLSDISCCRRVDANTHKSKIPYLPPNFRHSNEVYKLIKVRISISPD